MTAIVEGNLTKDAQVLKSESGKERLTFTVAFSERNRDKSIFVPVVYFREAGKLAEYLVKGKEVRVIGKADTNQNGYLNGLIASEIALGRSPGKRDKTEGEPADNDDGLPSELRD